MEEYAAEPEKVHLNNNVETIRNNLILKSIEQMHNFRSNSGDLKNSKQSLKYNFIFQNDMLTKKKNRYLLC